MIPITPSSIKVACSNCNLRELCMPMGLSTQELDKIDELVAVRKKIKRGDFLFQSGTAFKSIYAIRTGFFKTMSREFVRENSVILLLGSMKAEERLAAFLLNLVQRLHARGFSQSELVLRMTREEIGSFLGLKLETVSRAFSKFADEGIVEVKQRNLKILNPDALKLIMNSQDHCD